MATWILCITGLAKLNTFGTFSTKTNSDLVRLTFNFDTSSKQSKRACKVYMWLRSSPQKIRVTSANKRRSVIYSTDTNSYISYNKAILKSTFDKTCNHFTKSFHYKDRAWLKSWRTQRKWKWSVRWWVDTSMGWQLIQFINKEKVNFFWCTFSSIIMFYL